MDLQTPITTNLSSETIAEIAKVVQSMQPPTVTAFHSVSGVAGEVLEKSSGFWPFVGTVAKWIGGAALGAFTIHAIVTNRVRIWNFIKKINFGEVIKKTWDFAKKAVCDFGRWIKKAASWVYEHVPPVKHIGNFFHRIGRWITGKGWTLPGEQLEADLREVAAAVALGA